MAFGDEVKGLAEAKEEDDVNDAEGGHVSQYHAVNHGHEGTSQGNCSENKIKNYFEDFQEIV